MQKVLKSDIESALNKGTPIELRTDVLTPEDSEMMTSVVTDFLTLAGRSDMVDHVVYCLNELLTNAKKANTKRVYFEENGWKLDNPNDYKSGMAEFKQATLSNIDHYIDLMQKKGLYIIAKFQVQNGIFLCEIRNNCKLVLEEYKRIHDKITRAQNYESVHEPLTELVDNSEGAGLGLIILIIMLKKFGLQPDGFSARVEGEETRISFRLPIFSASANDYSALYQELIGYVESLPQFRESILAIKKQVDSPTSTITDVANAIRTDVSLCADLLKLVNSAAYGLSSKVNNITEAVKLVGLKGISNLILSVGTLGVLGDDTSDKHQIWHHSFAVASYMQTLSHMYKNKLKLAEEDVYVCGLLHDMGKIAFASLHPDIQKRMEALCKNKNIPSRILEELLAGLNHDETGSMIAARWNFPESVVNAIHFHHNYANAPEAYKKISYTTAFANVLYYYNTEVTPYEKMPADLLSFFEINNEEKLKELATRVGKEFEREQQLR